MAELHNGRYEKIRPLLFHEGADEERLAQVLKENFGLRDAEEGADLLEAAFKAAWNALVLGSAREEV